jgi:hypothetical protein
MWMTRCHFPSTANGLDSGNRNSIGEGRFNCVWVLSVCRRSTATYGPVKSPGAGVRQRMIIKHPIVPASMCSMQTVASGLVTSDDINETLYALLKTVLPRNICVEVLGRLIRR